MLRRRGGGRQGARARPRATADRGRGTGQRARPLARRWRSRTATATRVPLQEPGRAADALDETGGRRAAARLAVLEPARASPAAATTSRARARPTPCPRDGQGSLLLFGGEVSTRAISSDAVARIRRLPPPPFHVQEPTDDALLAQTSSSRSWSRWAASRTPPPPPRSRKAPPHLPRLRPATAPRASCSASRPTLISRSAPPTAAMPPRQARHPHRRGASAVAAGSAKRAEPRAAVVAPLRPPPRHRAHLRRRLRRAVAHLAAAVGGDAAAVGGAAAHRRSSRSRRPTAASSAAHSRTRRPSRTMPSGFRRPADYSPRHAETSDDIFSPKKKKAATPKEGRWVHISDLWALRAAEGRAARSSGSLSSRAARGPSRAPATPLSACRRASAPSSPAGGRSTAVVLRDLYVLDAEATAWTLIEFCGVPPSARGSCVGSLALSSGADGLRRARAHLPQRPRALLAQARVARRRHPEGGRRGCGSTRSARTRRPATARATRRRGSRRARLLVFGGHSTDDDGCEGNFVDKAVVPSAVALPELSETRRRAPPSRIRLTVRGRGFKVGANHMRFTVPTAPTPPPPPSSSLRGAAFPLKKLASEAAVIVPAELDADGVTLRCVTPDLSDLVCDGSVLVEACVCETASDMQWTHDELELDSSPPSTSPASASPASHRRRRSPPSPARRASRASLPSTAAAGGARAARSNRTRRRCASRRELPRSREGRGGRRRGGGDVGDAEAACRDLGNGSHDAKIVCERAGRFVLCVLLEGNIVLERPITVAPAPTDAPSCELQITAQMVRGNSRSFAPARSAAFSVAPRDRYGNASGGAPTAAAKTFSWASSPPKRKEEEGKEAAPAKADADDDEAAAADALAKAEATARAKANGRPVRGADGGGGGGARRRVERGRHPPRGAPSSSSRATLTLLVHHKLGGERPARQGDAPRDPATIDVPEAHVEGSGMHDAAEEGLRQRRARDHAPSAPRCVRAACRASAY